jgi:ABC-type lipoprotein release transport system permease subunit
MILIQLAWRNVWRNKLRSVVIMTSIVIGMFAGLSVLSLYKGMMTDRIRTVIDHEIGHIQIHAPHFIQEKEAAMVLPEEEQIYDALRKHNNIKYFSSRTITQGMLSSATGTSGVQINGIDPEREYTVSKLDRKLISGHLFTDKKNEILIGKKLAEKFKLKSGNKVVLTFTDRSNNLISGAFRIAGIYQTVNAPLDERNVFIKKNELGNLLDIGNQSHEIAIILKRDNLTDEVVSELRNTFKNIHIADWKELSPETNLLVKTVDDYSYIIIVIIMLALAFGITNTMLMAVLERKREIGMMMALGTSKLKINLLIILETLLLTLTGVPIGLLLGWSVIGYFNKTGLDFSNMGKDLMSSFGFGSKIYPEFPSEKMIPIMMIVLLTAFISSIIPLIKTLNMKPAEAIKI